MWLNFLRGMRRWRDRCFPRIRPKQVPSGERPLALSGLQNRLVARMERSGIRGFLTLISTARTAPDGGLRPYPGYKISVPAVGPVAQPARP